MVANHEAGFAVDHKPEVMLNAGNFNHGFIRVPFVGIQVKQRQELNSQVVEERRKPGTPTADCRMGNFDVKGSTQDEADIAERVFAEIEHAKGSNNEVNRIAHSFEVAFSKQGGHGWG